MGAPRAPQGRPQADSTVSKRPAPGKGGTPHTATSARAAAMKMPIDRDPDTVSDPKLRKAYLDRLTDIAAEDDSDQAQSKARNRAPVVSRDPDNTAGGKGLSSHPLTSSAPAQSVAGAILGAIATGAVINFLRGGWPGVTEWVQAKFLNKTTDAPKATTTTPQTIPSPSTLQAAVTT